MFTYCTSMASSTMLLSDCIPNRLKDVGYETTRRVRHNERVSIQLQQHWATTCNTVVCHPLIALHVWLRERRSSIGLGHYKSDENVCCHSPAMGVKLDGRVTRCPRPLLYVNLDNTSLGTTASVTHR
mmetsp:Transcript_2845/g.10336  ORF Transcript_2845/g.10336 Transcript_2845/m.10336 type:complete len:127 (-) Transcript_2845:833-1213(-)